MSITKQAPYWRRYIDHDGNWRDHRRPNGADLAALRKGIGREPGTVPAMWPFYTGGLGQDAYVDPRADTWQPHPSFVAEHHAMTLYGVHQQSQTAPAHKPGVGVGSALAKLRIAPGASTDAVDRRFRAAIAAATVDQFAVHLRGLITQLKRVTPLPALDYDQLTNDLAHWPDADRRTGIQRRWGLDYQRTTRLNDSTADTAPEGSDR